MQVNMDLPTNIGNERTVASSLNGSKRRIIERALLSPIVPGEKNRYVEDEGVTSLDDDIGLMESHSFDDQVYATRESARKRNENFIFESCS